jgi:hypothetical protein
VVAETRPRHPVTVDADIGGRLDHEPPPEIVPFCSRRPLSMQSRGPQVIALARVHALPLTGSRIADWAPRHPLSSRQISALR